MIVVTKFHLRTMFCWIAFLSSSSGKWFSSSKHNNRVVSAAFVAPSYSSRFSSSSSSSLLLSRRGLSVQGKHVGISTSSSTASPSFMYIDEGRKSYTNNSIMGFRMSSTRMFGSKTTDKESEGGEENENGEIEIDETQLVQDMLYRIRQVNNLPKDIELIDFQVDGILLGKVRPKIVQMLCDMKISLNDDDDSSNKMEPVFEVITSDEDEKKSILTLCSSIISTSKNSDTPDTDAGTSIIIKLRTDAVGKIMNQLRADGIITGWRDEQYPVSETFYSEPLFFMERSAVSLLGILEYGVHINGLVYDTDNDDDDNDVDDQQQQQKRRRPRHRRGPKMWIGRRSKTKSKYPGMLDHIVAGGQPAGLSLLDNVIKECNEEAGISPDLVRADAGDDTGTLQSVGAISYQSWDATTDRITRCVLFNYDLYLPKDFVPKPNDDEVDEFFLWTIDEVKQSMYRNYHDPIKPNCYIVIIDYLLRMGYISPQTPGYLDILRELRSGDCQ